MSTLRSKKYTLNYLIGHIGSISTSNKQTFVGFANELAPVKGTKAKEFVAIARWLGLSISTLFSTLNSLSATEAKRYLVKSLKARKKNSK